MKPKFVEGDLVRIIGPKRTYGVVAEMTCTSFGYIYTLGDVKADPFKEQRIGRYKENQLVAASKTMAKRITQKASTLFDPSELDFLATQLQLDVSDVVLVKSFVSQLFSFLCFSSFPKEMDLGLKADDSKMAFMVRIIEKLGKLLGVSTSSIKSDYYLHLANGYISKTPVSPQDSLNIKELLTKAGELGNYEAYATLGAISLYGLAGFPIDLLQAEKYLTLGSKKGNTSALCSLGFLYSTPGYYGFNLTKAYSYFSASALCGSDEGMFQSAKYLMSGLGTEKNTRTAYNIYLRLFYKEMPEFNSGNYLQFIPEAAYALGNMLLIGQDIKTNRREALFFLMVSYVSLMRRPSEFYLKSKLSSKDVYAQITDLYSHSEKEVKNRFSKTYLLSEKHGFTRFFSDSTVIYRINNITQDLTAKHATVSLSILNTTVPIFQKDGSIRLYDKVLLRFEGADPIIKAVTNFYLGIPYRISYREMSGQTMVFFTRDDGLDYFDVGCDYVSVSWDENINKKDGK